MRPRLHPVLVGGLFWSLAGGCAAKNFASSSTGPGGSGSGAQGGTSSGSGGSVAGSSAGKVSSAGSGGAAAGASASGAGGNDVGGSGAESGDAEGGDGNRGGSQSAGMSGDGSGGAEAGTGGSVTAGTGGTSACPPGQIWCAGCTVNSGTCAMACVGAECGPCDLIESLEECEARTDCHSVFEDPQACGCAGVGCCAHFARCADNERADCTGANVSCDAMTPYCEAPAYVVSYSGFCYEGCVAPKDCAPSPPTPCPPSVPVNGSACGGDTQCYYDACPAGERSIATCSGRLWNVEAGTSCAVVCSGVGEQCSEGEICLVHEGGALLVECVENGCGTGPILQECAGNCPVSFSLYGGATVTCNTCPQGGCP